MIVSKKLDLFKSEYPYNSFCIFNKTFLKDNIDIEKFKIINKLYSKEVNDNIIFYQTDEHINNIFFSGYCFHDDTFYYGDKDLNHEHLLVKEENINLCGAYSLLKIMSNGDTFIESDQFNFDRIFYFMDKEYYCVSNNYHLLTLCLSLFSRKIVLDNDIIKFYLSFHYTLLRQPLNNKLFIKNTYILNCYENIKIIDNKFSIYNNKLYSILNSNYQFDEELYKNLLVESKNEIEKNINSIYKNDRFNKYILQLSGGKDSRINASLLSEENKLKTIVQTNYNEENDVYISSIITDKFNFNYISEEIEYEFNNFFDYINMKRSCNMGYRFLCSYPHYNKKKNTNVITITGDSAEMFYVRYYSDYFVNTNKDLNMKDNDMLEILANEFNKYIITNRGHFKDMLKENLQHVLIKFPNISPIEVYDKLFLLYRGGIHANYYCRNFFEDNTVMPIQSINLIKAHKMVTNNISTSKYMKTLFDFQYICNADYDNIPYNNKKFNKEKLELKQKNLLLHNNIDNKYIDINEEYKKKIKSNYDSNWKKQKQLAKYYIKDKNIKKILPDFNDENPISWCNDSRDKILKTNIIHILSELKEYLENEIYEDMRNFVETKANSVDFIVIFNKLSSIYDITNIIYK